MYFSDCVFMCPWSCIRLFKVSFMLLQKHWGNIKVQTNVQSIDWTSFIQAFQHWKDSFVAFQQHLWASIFLLCKITVSLIICFQKNVQNKGNRKHKLSSHSTSHLKSKKPSGQSSVKAFLNKNLPEYKCKLNMITSESCCCEKFQF